MWFKYWKKENEEHLYYLFKIVYNKPIYTTVKNEYDLYNGFCSFVFNLQGKQEEKKEKEKGYDYAHDKEDEIFYIYYFLKDYDNNGCLNLFTNLTLNGLKKYLLSHF
jgi:hypothetical protein